MKNQLRSILRQTSDYREKRLLLREYLHHLILRQLFEMKLLSQWIFLGGTALRIGYRLNRYSEDLDFHLLTPHKDYSFARIIHPLAKRLTNQGYQVTESAVCEKAGKFSVSVL